MNCPLCIDQTLEARHRQGIEIDICPKCHGIWLDRGEMERLMSDSADAAPPREPSRTSHDDRDRHEPRPKKKKSFADKLSGMLEDVMEF